MVNENIKVWKLNDYEYYAGKSFKEVLEYARDLTGL
jgi:hypothetical protein